MREGPRSLACLSQEGILGFVPACRQTGVRVSIFQIFNKSLNRSFNILSITKSTNANFD